MVVLRPSSCYHSSLSSYILQCLFSASLLSSVPPHPNSNPPHPNSKRQSLRHHCIFVCMHFSLYQDTFPSPLTKPRATHLTQWAETAPFLGASRPPCPKSNFVASRSLSILWQFFVTCFLMVRLRIGYSSKLLNKGKEIIVSGTKSKLMFPPRHHMNMSLGVDSGAFYLVALLSPWCGLSQLTPH